VTKNIEFIARGNHKSAIKYNDEYLKIVKAEISQGWMFPIPLHYINTLMHGELAPVGIDDKVWSEQADGSKKRKLRLTHDQSFEASCGSPVNGRVIKEKLAPLFYGGCLSRIIHYVVDLRLRHPTIPILGAKSDFKAAYRRVSLHGDIAEKCAIMYDEFALPSLRLTFGGSPCPNEFCIYSELSIDLANDLLHTPNWDPKVLCSQALLLAIHTLCRPLDPNEPISREDCLSLGKLAEEGKLSENFTILGWDINTRKMQIALPAKKFKQWTDELGEIIFWKKVSFGKLESTIGRLNHAASVCLLMRYFLSRIRIVLTAWDVSCKSKKVE